MFIVYEAAVHCSVDYIFTRNFECSLSQHFSR